ncbi:polymerase of teichuronic acid repeating units, partial [Listeria fleischmannii subsp. coloradonensis]
YILLLILLLLISVCSLFVADYVELGLRYCYFMVEIICIFILCFYHLKNKKQMKKLFQIISSIFNISLVLGLVENLTGWHLWLSGSNVYVTLTSKLQPTGFLYNTNDYALFMGILYPFAAYLFLEMKHKYLGRLLYIVTTFLTLYIIISTYSRIGMLVAIISITTVYFYQFKKRGSIILFILTPVLFLIIKFTSIGGLMSKTVYSAYTDKFTSTDAREHLYLLLIKIIRDSNFIGVGAGNVPNKLNNLLLGYTSDGYTTGHNYWLETFGNLGFVGFIVCICIFILFLFQLLKSGCLKKSPIPLLIWIAFLGASIALSTILEKRFLWFILAVGICLIKQAYKEGLNRDTC